MRTTMLSLAEQIHIFDEYADDCFENMLLEMSERREEIIETARGRLIDGFSEYGDEMFTWDDARRDCEWLQEVADGVNYKVSECF